MTEFYPGNRLIAALDVPTGHQALDLIRRMGNVPTFYKVGLELFSGEGPDIVRDLAKLGYRVMLDLKLHDIPETVGRTMAGLASLGAELVTVHASGGVEMLGAAVRNARQMRVLAVTTLTSMPVIDALVVSRAATAIETGCAGVVVPPAHALSVFEIAPPGFLIVTPGIRPAGAPSDDHKEAWTPRQARDAGADLVVVGRPIRDADDPAAVARAIVAELA